MTEVIAKIPPGGEHGAEPRDAQRFWASLYEAAYGTAHRTMTAGELTGLLDDLEELFRRRQHLAAVEMPSNLRGRDVLEIGSGAGAHSVVFARRGARVTALDLTAERAAATARKFDLVPGVHGLTLRGDAAMLPFPNAAFDIVYSNGVLHHTSRVADAIKEVHRVLKPGGRALIMLYARNSFRYRAVLLPVRGILQGGIWRDSQWLGRATEWMSSKPQPVDNPCTAVFSKREVECLFRLFSRVAIRQGSFTFDQVPLIGRAVARLAGRYTGTNPAGVLVYDRPWRNETALELWLGRYIGWGLNIEAVK
jgi:ubiquinone/menaquinone biosynthesis C-methylase UbiE